MIEKSIAIEIKARALRAVAELDGIIVSFRETLSEEDMRIVKRGVGLSIGKIQIELLRPVYDQDPEIDDLAKF